MLNFQRGAYPVSKKVQCLNVQTLSHSYLCDLFSSVRPVIHHSEMNSSSLTDLADVNFTSFVGVHISLFYVFPLTSPGIELLMELVATNPPQNTENRTEFSRFSPLGHTHSWNGSEGSASCFVSDVIQCDTRIQQPLSL